jgi:hypothetical protein
MIQPHRVADVGELLADSERVTDAVRRAGREAGLRHKQLGVPLVVWRDGQIVHVPPEEIVVDLPSSPAALSEPRTLYPKNPRSRFRA